MKLRRTAAIYAIIVGIAMVGMWSRDLLTGQVPELITEPIDIILTIVAEYLTAVALMISGFGLIKKRSWGFKAFLLSMGFLLYSVMSAAGYFGQKGEFVMLGMMVVIFILAVVFAVFALQKESLGNQ